MNARAITMIDCIQTEQDLASLLNDFGNLEDEILSGQMPIQTTYVRGACPMDQSFRVEDEIKACGMSG